jgi:HAD superfamily hydrolase (TIGR01458 family)
MIDEPETPSSIPLEAMRSPRQVPATTDRRPIASPGRADVQKGTINSLAVRGILMDLGGVIYVGSTPIEGAIAAVEQLRHGGIPLRFITNTTRRSRRQVIADLSRMGLRVEDNELLTPALMARSYLEKHSLSPFLVVHPELEKDFAGLAPGRSEAVVVGDAGEFFTYDHLNRAYRKIAAGAALLALAMNRNFKDRDGELSLDAGPFVVALEFATKRKAVLLGKPSPEFFTLAIDSLGCDRAHVVMIGDDAEADVGGAMAAGIKGILVRTGKYRPGDETELALAPNCVADNISEAAEWILSQRRS